MKITPITIKPLTPPDLTKRAFIKRGSSYSENRTNARIAHPSDKVYLYLIGYERAAELLTDASDTNDGWKNVLVYPIMFAYRHVLELYLKRIGNLGIRLGYLDGSKTFEKSKRKQKCTIAEELCRNHSLFFIFDLINPVISKITEKEDAVNWIQPLEEFFKTYDKIDEQSDAFRYPLGTKGCRHLADVEYINIKAFQENVKSVIGWLEGSCCMLDEQLSFQKGLKRECMP